MKWINFYGIAIMAVILIPNIVFAATHKDGFENLYRNKIAEVFEQTGRFAYFDVRQYSGALRRVYI